ncbi:hypothetical protein PIB30_076287 [Stylosanthes scabra]|uniref:Uncharacterized protein n=1 Tax=Stylosanthes scabra TaxID=79078 RepID=A0ABU6VNN0_9FABA|nr:hypothetical protein [Stylosanthes scabra]
MAGGNNTADQGTEVIAVGADRPGAAGVANHPVRPPPARLACHDAPASPPAYGLGARLAMQQWGNRHIRPGPVVCSTLPGGERKGVGPRQVQSPGWKPVVDPGHEQCVTSMHTFRVPIGGIAHRSIEPTQDSTAPTISTYPIKIVQQWQEPHMHGVVCLVRKEHRTK